MDGDGHPASDAGLDLGLDAATLVGLLADADRLRVVAALALGATELDDVVRAAGLDTRRVSRALRRLEVNGLVLRDPDGSSYLVEAAFALAARAEAARRPKSDDEHADAPAERARVLRAFVRDDRLVSIPASHGKRLVVLDWLVQRFDPGRRYSEREVNAIISRVNPDTAALRRSLVDEEMLSREAGVYWRTGGTFQP